MPLANDKLLVAAQYAYNYRLSKPYTNTKCPWDWGYPDNDTGPIWRPNHGLAHSARGAMYAPTVIEYFKSVTANPEYNFSEADIEKIQIALMFRVTGRENESGFTDDKDAYASYQAAHAQNFREYCKANPGVFNDDVEIEKYAQILQTYANPTSTSPLAIIFKTCHNLDLIRVRDPDGLKKELAIPTQLLGETNVKQLMLYADSCIRATGSRILYNNPIIGRGAIGYEDGVFRLASTNPTQCLKIIDNIPKPPKPIVDRIPAKDITFLKDVLMNYSNTDVENAAISVYSLSDTSDILIEVSELMAKDQLTTDAKLQILQKTRILLSTILKQEIPLTLNKTLVEYLISNKADAVKYAENHEVKSLCALLDNLAKAGIVPAQVDKFYAELVMSANMAAEENQKALRKKTEAAEKPDIIIDAGTIIQQELFDDPKTPHVAETIKYFADALKQKNTEYMLGINLADLASPFRAKVASVGYYLEFTSKLRDSITYDLLTAKSKEHQVEIFLYYVRVMEQCLLNKDFNSLNAIYRGLTQNQNQVMALKHATDALPVQDKFNFLKCRDFLDSKKPNSYFYMNKKDIDIPIMSDIIPNLNNASETQVLQDKDGAMRVNLKGMSDAGKVYREFSDYRERLRTAAVTQSNIDISRIDNTEVLTAVKKNQLLRRMNPGTAFDLIQLDLITNLESDLDVMFTKLLNDHLKIPINIQVESKGIPCGAQTYEQLVQYLVRYKSALESNAATLHQPMKSYEKIAILALSIQEYGANNKNETPASLKVIQEVQQFAALKGVTPDLHKLRESQRRINQFKQGKPSLMKINIPVPMGPLYKVNYTREYEELMKGILAGKKFKVKVVSNEAIVMMNGIEYNLQKIIKYANLNQLTLNDQDKASYEKMLTDNAATLKFPPCFPPNCSKPVRTAADIKQLNDHFNNPTFTEIADLTLPERMALNIYTTGFYDTVNPFLRGKGADNTFLDINFVRELVCHTGMAICALNKVTVDVPNVSFRTELSDPNNIPAYMQKRIDAAKTGGVTMESGFVSTAQEKPKLMFGDPDNPGGVGIIYKDLKGKDVRNLSAFTAEREFLLPPTQIQWHSYNQVKQGHILEGKPVTTPLDLAPEAISTEMFSPEKQAYLNDTDKFYSDKIAATKTPSEFVMALMDISDGVKDKKGADVHILKIFAPISVILADPVKVADIAFQPLKFVPDLEAAGVSNQFGILSKFLEIVEKQNDIYLHLQAEKNFKNALNGAATVVDMLDVIRSYSKNSFIDMGKPNVVELMLVQMDEIASSPKVAREIFEKGTLPIDQCSDILSKYDIKDVFFELIARQYEAELANVIANIQNATSLNELIDVVSSNIKAGYIDMGSVNAVRMIDTMRHYANNREAVHAIAKHGDKSMLLKSSEIINDYGISAQFIRLAVQQDLRQQLTKNVASAKNVDDLIQMLEDATLAITDEAGGVDKIRMVQNMKDILRDKDMLEFLFNNPKQRDLVFTGTSITTAHGIREKFVEFATQRYQDQYTQKAAKKPEITRQKPVTFSQSKTEASTKSLLLKSAVTGADIKTNDFNMEKKKI